MCEIACKNCKFFGKKVGEHRIQQRFLSSSGGYGLAQVGDHWGIHACQHEVCFETREYKSPVEGTFTVEDRVNGQGILNKNNDCKYFEERKSFWKRLFGAKNERRI